MQRLLPPHTSARWEPVTPLRLAVFSTGFLLFLLAVWNSERGFIPVLDHANLLFHEAGHFFVGLFSRRLEIYGGTLGQLVFPTVLAVHFHRQGQSLGFATALIWLFQNGLNIARYVADARARSLPLVGGGLHDWNTILSRWDLLEADRQIALVLQILSALGLLATVVGVLVLARRTGNRDHPLPPAPPPL